MSAFDEISVALERLRARDLYRRRRVVDSALSREVRVGDRQVLNFCSNDYLGLANEPRIAAAFKEGVDRWGTGAGASHLVCGHTAAHHELEEALAEFTGRERALLFSSGYSANVGTVNALVGQRDAVFEDRLNHASLLDGGWISRAEFRWYEHANVNDLERQLESLDEDRRRRLVVTDGTFSMDGDLCPVAELADAARRHDAWLMIDDAHGIGVCGEGGRGVVDPARFGTSEVPVLMATLGKAFGTFGAFVAGDEVLIEYLVQRARNYIYTTALPSAVAVATLASLRIATAEEWRREKLRELIGRFRDGAKQLDIDVLPSATPIQPVVIGDSAAALAASAALEARGILVTAIRPPTVPQGTARLRITLTAAHEHADVDRLLDALAASQNEPDRAAG
ncbi:MAG: 8-amino-7-oxononanoate synthase [Gammaproteobacteria bacterium]